MQDQDDLEYLIELHAYLTLSAKRIYRGARAYEGKSVEDHVSDVITEVAAFLRGEAPLHDDSADPCTYDDLRAYAVYRMKQWQNTDRRRAERRFTNAPSSETLIALGLLRDHDPFSRTPIFPLDYFDAVRKSLRDDDDPLCHDLMYVIEHYREFVEIEPFEITDLGYLARRFSIDLPRMKKIWNRVRKLLRIHAQDRRRVRHKSPRSKGSTIA